MFQNTKTFKYNDINSFERVFKNNKEKIAAVILEPMNIEWPDIEFLKKLEQCALKIIQF